MDASKDGALDAAEALAGRWEMLQGVEESIHNDYIWSEHVNADVQVSVVEWNIACRHSLASLSFA